MTSGEPKLPDMVCAACLRPLSRLNDAWVHPAIADHDPVPIRRTEAPAVDYRCDFCCAADPRWCYRTDAYQRLDIVREYGEYGRPRPITPRTWKSKRDSREVASLVQDFGTDWLACDDCARLVDEREPYYLARRVKQATSTDASLNHISNVYRELFPAIRDKQPWPPADTTPPGFDPDMTQHKGESS